MLKNSKRLMTLIVFFLLITYSIECNAMEVITINQLIENAEKLNQTEVTIQGELIGEALERGEYAWVNINDTSNAIGVYIKTEDLSQIEYYGDYKNIGDTVMITGVFSNACSEHGGDVDIHCETIKLVEQGQSVAEVVPLGKIVTASALLVVMTLVLVVYIRVIKRQPVK